jgi:rod shape-determining protein MreC
MKKLFAFFSRFQIFLLFAGLQFLVLSNYFSSLTFPRSQYLTTANAIAGNIWAVQNNFLKFVRLEQTNDQLVQANKILMEKLPESFVRLSSKTFSINDSIYEQQYNYIPATVINSTFGKQNNFLTINIGEKLGVERGMGVFNEKGIVGIVHSVSKHFSIIKSVIAQDINVGVMIESNMEEAMGEAFGLMKWETSNSRIVNIDGISNDLTIDSNARVYTRGGAGIFPRGIPVGKVKSFKNVEGKPLWEVEVKLGVDFRSIQKVYIIKNLLKDEQMNLEEKIPVDIK